MFRLKLELASGNNHLVLYTSRKVLLYQRFSGVLFLLGYKIINCSTFFADDRFSKSRHFILLSYFTEIILQFGKTVI